MLINLPVARGNATLVEFLMANMSRLGVTLLEESAALATARRDVPTGQFAIINANERPNTALQHAQAIKVLGQVLEQIEEVKPEKASCCNMADAPADTKNTVDPPVCNVHIRPEAPAAIEALAQVIELSKVSKDVGKLFVKRFSGGRGAFKGVQTAAVGTNLFFEIVPTDEVLDFIAAARAGQGKVDAVHS